MLKKSFFSVVLFFALTAVLNAGEIYCRSGKIVSAELTKRIINIINLDPLAFPDMPEKRFYAVISVKLDDLRSISIFDYSLEIAGVTVPCVAILRNNKFEYFTEKISDPGIHQLLFAVDESFSTATSGVEKLVLKSNLAPGSFRVTVPFSIIGNKAPVEIKEIPEDGLLEMEE